MKQFSIEDSKAFAMQFLTMMSGVIKERDSREDYTSEWLTPHAEELLNRYIGLGFDRNAVMEQLNYVTSAFFKAVDDRHPATRTDTAAT